jgi:hypothetical protein
MLRAWSTIKSLHSSFPHTCWVRHVLTLAMYVAQKEEAATWSLVKMLLSSRRTQPPVDCLWSLVPSFPGLSVNSNILSFLTWYWTVIHLYVTICVKIDLGIHIVMHLVFFGKTGVTHIKLYTIICLQTKRGPQPQGRSVWCTEGHFYRHRRL